MNANGSYGVFADLTTRKPKNPFCITKMQGLSSRERLYVESGTGIFLHVPSAKRTVR